MNVKAMVAGMEPALLAAFVKAVEQKCIFRRLSGSVYAARRESDGSWWMWNLAPGSQEYALDQKLTRCTCPCFQNRGECKHLKSLKYG